MVALLEHLVRRVHAARAGVVDDHVAPTERVAARYRDRVAIDDVRPHVIKAPREWTGRLGRVDALVRLPAPVCRGDEKLVHKKDLDADAPPTLPGVREFRIVRLAALG